MNAIGRYRDTKNKFVYEFGEPTRLVISYRLWFELLNTANLHCKSCAPNVRLMYSPDATYEGCKVIRTNDADILEFLP